VVSREIGQLNISHDEEEDIESELRRLDIQNDENNILSKTHTINYDSDDNGTRKK
jgi:hypothetical protein